MMQSEIISDALAGSSLFIGDGSPHELMLPGLYTRMAVENGGGVVKPCRKLQLELLDAEFKRFMIGREATAEKFARWLLRQGQELIY